MTIYKEIHDICSGSRTSTRNVGDDITSEDVWDTYVHIPGAAAIIDKPIEAIYHNGFQDWELDHERLLELEKAHKFRDIFGFSVIVFDGENIQAWNPKVQGVGFTLSKFDNSGICTEIKIYNNPNISDNIGIPVSSNNFILLRTPEGLAGPRGLSKLLNLIDVVRVNFEIWAEYSKYAFHQGLAHPVLKIKDLDSDKYNAAESALSAPTKDDAVIIDVEDDFDYKSPQSNAYDPVPMLEYGDTYVTRESSLSRLQIYGDPGGIIATSETATSNWYAHIKELQELILPSILPILIRLGAPEDVQFNEPGEYNIATQMNGVLQIRMALDGKIPDEQLIRLINRYLGLKGKDELTPLSDEEKLKLEQKKLGFEYNPKGEENVGRESRNDSK